MVEPSAASTPSITMSFLHDGRVGLELMEDWYRTYDLQVASVDDLVATSEIFRAWAVQPRAASRPRYEAYAEFPEHAQAYSVTLSAQPNEGIRRFTEMPDQLSHSLVAAFAPGDSEQRAIATDRFATDLARKMRTFAARSRRQAAARLAGGLYVSVLEAYLTELQSVRALEDQSYYERLEFGIGGIMSSEQYLLLSDDARVRDLYTRIQDEQGSLYQWYMDLAKGGVERAR